jgi:hypothetical protein
MKKNSLLIFGVIAVAGFFAWKKGLFGKKAETTEPETIDEESKGETTPGKPGTATPGTATPGQSAPATIIDVTKGNITVPQAIEQAKDIVEKFKSLRVLIKTPKGQKNIQVSRKKKKPKTKRAKKTRNL